MGFLIFSAMCMRNHHLFCTSSQHNVPYEKQQELNKGSEPSRLEWPHRILTLLTYLLLGLFFQLYLDARARAILFCARAFLLI